MENVTVSTTCGSVGIVQTNIKGNFTTSTQIDSNLINLISSNVESNGSIILPQTFNFPMTFPLVFINKVTKGITTGVSPITAASTVTGYICNAIGAGINDTSSINGTIKNSPQLKSSLVVTTSILDSSFTGLIPLSGTVKLNQI